jgi:hypothetical protein
MDLLQQILYPEIRTLLLNALKDVADEELPTITLTDGQLASKIIVKKKCE